MSTFDEAVEAAARAVKCRGCGSEAGEQCWGLNITTFHTRRTEDARAILTSAGLPELLAALAEMEDDRDSWVNTATLANETCARLVAECDEARAALAAAKGSSGCDVCGKPSTHVTTPGGMRGCDDHFGGRS